MISSVENKKLEMVCGIPVHSLPHIDVLNEMDSNIQGGRKSLYISITNTESMYHALRITKHFNYIKNATFSLCDGIGVIIGGRFQGVEIERFNGPALMMEACEYGVEKKWRHFFCGGKEGVADLLAEKLSEKLPDLIVAGTYCPPFRELTSTEELNFIQQVNDSKADIVWVGLGLLKQEAWVEKYIEKLDVPWMSGVGAAFDFHAGTARWAPKWIRSIGFEWLYRLILEPRMFKRNVWSFVFMFQAIIDGVFQKKRSKT